MSLLCCACQGLNHGHEVSTPIGEIAACRACADFSADSGVPIFVLAGFFALFTEPFDPAALD